MARSIQWHGTDIEYYDVLIIGKTGMGKSCTADKILIANLQNRDYRGEPYIEETMEDGRMVMSDLSIWLISDVEVDRVSYSLSTAMYIQTP